MATQIELTKNYSGIFGNRVMILNRNGKSIMTIPLKRTGTTVPTTNMVIARRRFTHAAQYAKNILQDPAMLAFYAAKTRKGLTPYLAALSDYLKPPVVEDIDVTAYHGNAGDNIAVTAIDDFAVAAVTVKITDSAGILLEDGPGTPDPVTGIYNYTATADIADPAGVTITATATDTPGNKAQLTITL